MVIRVYIAAAFVAALFFIYWAGMRAGRDGCRVDMGNVAAENVTDTIQQIKEIDDVVIKTDTDNIRRILREKYTIAE